MSSKNWLPTLLALSLVAPCIVAEDAGSLPIVDGREVLASVNGEPITAEDLRWRIGAMHQGMGAADGMIRKPDISGLLQRVINARLIVQEAQQIGLDELDEITTTLEMGRKELVKRFLIDERVKNVPHGDPDVIDKLYRDVVLELKIRSARFQSREHATAFESTVRGGANFDDALQPYTDAGTVVLEEGPFLKIREMRPEVAAVLRELKPGEVTAALPVQDGFAVLEVLEERLPDNPQARADAEETARVFAQQEDLQNYTDELRETYATVQDDVLESLDFDSPDRDLDALRNDERVLAEVKGADPVTVKELTRRVENTLFHGIEKASQRGRINSKLKGVLERIILERTMDLEAARLKIGENPDFANALAAQEESVLFGVFVRRVVNPEIRISDEEVEAYYQEHLGDYMTSAMIRLQGLPFEDLEHAESGMQKLRQGSDLNWMRDHADGLIDVANEVDGVLKFGGQVLAVAMLPEGVQSAVEGAVAGDFRMYSHPGGAYYVLAVQEVYPAQPQKFDEVRDQILQRLFLEKREIAVERWTEDLRAASDIEVHASDDQIRIVLGLGPAGGA